MRTLFFPKCSFSLAASNSEGTKETQNFTARFASSLSAGSDCFSVPCTAVREWTGTYRKKITYPCVNHTAKPKPEHRIREGSAA